MPTKYFGTFDIYRLGLELKIHEWALKTCNLIASLPPLFPPWRKAKFSCWKFVHLILCELLWLWAEGQALLKKKKKNCYLWAPPLLKASQNCCATEIQVFLSGWESFHQVKQEKKKISVDRMRSWGSSWKRERRWERSSSCCLFSSAVFRSLKGIFPCSCGSCQLLLAHIPDRASLPLSAAGSWGHFRSSFVHLVLI